MHRFRRWLAWGIAFGALLYLGFSVWADATGVWDRLLAFQWWIYGPVLLLTVGNYSLRFWKWQYLAGKLGVKLPWRENLLVFAAGLAMVISPAKAGEVLKPYLVRERTGVPMARTIPALVTERLTDGIACVLLAAFSVTTYAGDQAWILVVLGAVSFGGIGVLMHEGLSLAILDLLVKLPGIGKVGSKLRELYTAMRVCVAPVPMALTILASLVAWGLECVGYLLVFRGFGFDVSLDLSTFLYAFATVAGGFMPGGLGMADGALVGGAMQFVPGMDKNTAVAAALLIRVATLWFGVFVGAFAMVRVAALLDPPKEGGGAAA